MKMLEIAPGAAAASPRIYVVDDDPLLTRMYTVLLDKAGYGVRAFNDRAEALGALKADGQKPDLLVTDYRGLSIPVDRFLRQCLVVHPAMRVLMASGFHETAMRFSEVRPDRFILKPFTGEEFCREVGAALTV